jgi:AcrR family transcriptional regulator
MPQQERATTTKAEIIASANKLVSEYGTGSMTLEAVAREAGVSKGGLLYHFANKDALIQGMIEHALEQFEQDVDQLAGTFPEEHGRWLKAFVSVTLEARPEHHPGSSILAAAASNTALLQPLGEYFSRWHERAIQDGCDPAVATVVRLASDGFWFADMFTSTAPVGAARCEVANCLNQLIDSGCSNDRKDA